MFLHGELTKEIIDAFYRVYNDLGYGFLEKVYQNALMLELKMRNFEIFSHKQIKVFYRSVQVGEYYADIIVNDLVILELKSAETIVKEFENQLLNYLKATPIEVGLLLNFGPKPEFRRKIFHNNRKPVVF